MKQINLNNLKRRVLTVLMAAIAFLLPAALQAQGSKSIVSGTVYDSEGELAIGATVRPLDSSIQGTMTDIDGYFQFSSTKALEVEVSYVGCESQKLTIKPGEAVEIHLKGTPSVLNEVVVVGFATQKKVNLTGSVGVATAKDIEGRPVQNAAAALQGVIPGLNISNSSSGGELNASKSINIRGIGTIDSSVSGSPLILIDGMEGDMNTLNPADIESISVLKDAAASSIYGSQAPFGVILITTKSGTSGKASVKYSDSFRFNKPLTPMKIMDSWEYLNYLNDVELYTSKHVRYEADFMEQAYQYYIGERDNPFYENEWAGAYRRWGKSGESNGVFANVNWLDELYKKTAFAQEHNLTINGGNDKITYYISGNFLDQSGFMKYGNDSYNRYSLMGKINAKPYSWLNIQYTSRWIRTEYDRPTWLDSGFYEKVMRRLPAINPKYDPNGYIAGDYNYILHLEEGGDHIEQNDIFTNQFKVIISPLKGWNITGEFNARVNSDWTHEDYKPVYTHDADDLEGLSHESVHLAFDSGDRSKVSERSYRQTFINMNLFTDYNFSIADKNDFKVLLGFQSEQTKQRVLSGNRRDLTSEDFPVLDLANASDDGGWGLGGNYQKMNLVGFFGRINYNFEGKYLAEVNMRYDGSSRFRRHHRWVASPSFSVGWNVDREKFWEPILDWFSALKIRGSYGQLSNQNTNSWYPTYRVMNVTNQGSNWLVNGSRPNTAYFPALIWPQLTWEKIRNTNIGTDFSFFNFRLNGSFDYYWRSNRDMVGPPRTYPGVAGVSAPKENCLSLTTYGWELSLGWQDKVGDFNYSAKINLSDDQTRIDQYPNPERYLSNYIAGELTGNIYGLTTIGVARDDEQMNAHLANVNQDAIGNDWRGGDIMYADINGDGEVTIGETLDDLGDLKLIGNTSPRYRLGLNLYGEWKGIDLTVFFQGVLKRDYYFNPNNGGQTLGKSAVFWGATSGGVNESIFLKDHLDYWRDETSELGENRDAYYARPLYYTNKNRTTQTRYLQNGAYLRLKNLQIGYTIPRNFTRKFYVDKIRVFFAAENLCTWTKMSKVIDPESLEVSTMKSGASYPLAKTFSFGVNVDL